MVKSIKQKKVKKNEVYELRYNIKAKLLNLDNTGREMVFAKVLATSKITNTRVLKNNAFERKNQPANLSASDLYYFAKCLKCNVQDLYNGEPTIK